eukprot:7714756-Pyramimonas_sp.AAC.1
MEADGEADDADDGDAPHGHGEDDSGDHDSEDDKPGGDDSDSDHILKPPGVFFHPAAEVTDIDTKAFILEATERQVEHHGRSLLAASVEAAERPTAVGPRCVSLVLKDGSAFFVWWGDCVIPTDRSSCMGWRLRLDKSNMIIYTVPYKKDREHFGDDVEIKVADIPVHVAKATGAGRTPMVEWALVVWTELSAKLYSAPLEHEQPHRHALRLNN